MLSSTNLAYSVASIEELPEDLGNSFQAFYHALEDELYTELGPSSSRKKEDKAHEEIEKDKADIEDRVRAILEKIERTLCAVFYDR